MEKFLKYQITPEFLNNDKNNAKFVLAPLEKGLGQTIGNALRRVCLSNIPGAAMFAIKVPGITHEFTAIPGVKEDLTQIILNLKKIIFKFKNEFSNEDEISNWTIENWPTLRISHKGIGEITAQDIIPNEYFDVLSPDTLIATVTDDIEFNLDIYVTIGRGFKPFYENKEKLNILSIIPTDSIFSPVLSCNFTVEEYKTSKLTTSDRLVFSISTNGSIDASNAISYGSKILQTHLDQLTCLNETIKQLELLEEQKEKQKKLLYIPIEELDFSVRTYNALKQVGIDNTQDLIQLSKNEIANIKNLGRKSLNEIIETVHERNLKLKDE